MNYQKEKYALMIFKTLANIHRMRIIELLRNSDTQPLTVNQLCEALKMNQGNISNHLIRMRKDGILKAKQDGTNIYYSIKDPNISSLLTKII